MKKNQAIVGESCQVKNKVIKDPANIDMNLAINVLSEEEIKKLKRVKVTHEEIYLKKEEKSLKANTGIFMREIKNDMMQLPLKYAAYAVAGAHSTTFWAELVRSGIDAINHAVIFATNQISIRPTKEYPYGLDKIKNIVVMLPASLFLLFGCETIYTAFYDYFYVQESVLLEESAHSSIIPVILYLTSLGIELCVIGQNLKDVYRQQNPNSQIQQASIISIFKALLQKKDPLLQVILFENAITLTSMSIPLMSGILSLFHPITIFEFIGTNVIGVIQLICGAHLVRENIYPLLGRGIDIEEVNEIKRIILHNKFVDNIQQEKTILIGHSKFRFCAEVQFNAQKLSQMILNEYALSVDHIVYKQDYEEREEDLKELLLQLPIRILKEIQIQKEIIEKQIVKRFPECIHIDLELDQDNLIDAFKNEENLKNFFFQANDDADDSDSSTVKEKKEPSKNKNRFLIDISLLQNEIDKYCNIQISTLMQMKNKKKYELQQKQKYQRFVREDPKFYSQHFSSLHAEEYQIIYEEMREQILNDDLYDAESNEYWQNSEDPIALFKQRTKWENEL